MRIGFNKIVRTALLGFIALVMVFALSAKTAEASGLIRPGNNLGLLSYWSFDDGRGALATDFSGGGNTGTLFGDTSWVTGKRARALYFDGSGDYVNATNIADNLSTMTVSAWVKAAENVSYRPIVGKINQINTAPGWGLYMHLGVLTFFTQENGGASYNQKRTLTTFNDDQWHHVVATLSGGPGGTIVIYVDGVAVGLSDSSTGTVTSYANSENIKIGSQGDLNSFLTGSIDEVRIYNRALTVTEVAALYGTGVAKISTSNIGPVPDNLVLWQTFDGAYLSSTTATDRSGDGNNGTVTGVSTITRVQYKHVYPGYTGTFDSPVTSGNLIVVFYENDLAFGAHAIPTDNCGNTYRAAVGPISASSFTVAGLYYAYNVTGGTCTITGSNLNDAGFTAVEYSGVVSAADPLGAVSYAVNSKTASSLTLTGPGMIFAGWGNEASDNYAGAGSGYTTIVSDNGHNDGVAEQLNIPAGTYTATFAGANSTYEVSMFAVFRAKPGPIPINGKSGQALSFDGTDDKTTIADASTVKFGNNPFSVAAWVKAPNANQVGPIISKHLWSGEYPRYEMSIAAADSYSPTPGKKIVFSLIELQSTGNIYRGVHTTNDIINGDWQHIVGVSTGSNLLIYVNGVSVPVVVDLTAGSWPNTDSTAPVQIGFDNNSAYFTGQIDDARVYNKALTDTEVAQLYNLNRASLNTSQVGSASSGLVLWHTFDGQYLNTTTSTDRSGQSYNGTLTGAGGAQNKPQPINGKVGQGLKFDGTDDTVNLGSTLKAQTAGVMTFSAWVRFNGDYTNQQILASDFEGGSDATFGLQFGRIDNAFEWYQNGSSFDASSAVTVNDDNWHHIVAIRSGSTGNWDISWYLDGVFSDTDNTSVNPSTGGTYTYLGSLFNSIMYLNATMDDVRIYNRVLTAAEVLSLYNGGR